MSIFETLNYQIEETSIIPPLVYGTRYLDLIDDNSLKIQDIRFKLVAFNRIRLTQQFNHRNMYLSMNNQVSNRINFDFRDSCI